VRDGLLSVHYRSDGSSRSRFNTVLNALKYDIFGDV
jgi:hypothetical protein